MEYNADSEDAFGKLCKTSGKDLERTGGVGTTIPFNNWKKAIQKMKAHAQNEGHVRAKQEASASKASQQAGSVIKQLQYVADPDRMRNRAAVKSFIYCEHFLAQQHIPHTTNFEKLVHLVVQCGGHDLKNFVEKTGRNAVYTSHVAVVEFIEA